jgi:virginiamycin B lyase
VLQAIGGHFQSKVSALIKVNSGKATEVNLSLTDGRAPMLPHAWPDSLPVAEMAKLEKQHGGFNLPEGPGKDLVQTRCQTCHTLARVVGGRYNLDLWTMVVTEMRSNMAAAHLPPNLNLTDEQGATVEAYLTKNFRPRQVDLNSRFPFRLVTGEARNYRVVTYMVQPKGALPHDVAAAPDGVMWAGLRGGKVLPDGALLRWDPWTLEVTPWYAPPGGNTPSDLNRWLGNPQITANGVLWITDEPNQRWLSFNTHTEQWKAWPVPAGHFPGANSMAIGHDGWIWATNESHQQSGVYSLNPATGQWRFYNAHTLHAGSYGMAISSDGTAWYAEDAHDKIGHAYPKTGKDEDLAIPMKGRLYPRRMESDAHNNVWVALWEAGKLMKIDATTKKMTIYSPPTAVPGCYGVAVDKVHDIIWVSEQQADKIARFDPKTGKWLEFSVPEAQSDERRLSISQAYPNRVFFSGADSGRIGFLEYEGKE